RMPNPALHVPDLSAGVALEPGAVELLGCSPELHDEVARQVLGLRFSSFLPPKPDQGGFIAAHDDAGVGTTDEGAAIYITLQAMGELRHLHSPFRAIIRRGKSIAQAEGDYVPSVKIELIEFPLIQAGNRVNRISINRISIRGAKFGHDTTSQGSARSAGLVPGGFGEQFRHLRAYGSSSRIDGR